MRIQLSLCCLIVSLVGCTTPPRGPVATPVPPSTPTPIQEFAAIAGDQVDNLEATPLSGLSAQLSPMLDKKLANAPGAYVPMLQRNAPDLVLLAFVPKHTPKELDQRPSLTLRLKGQLRTMEDPELAKKVEAMLVGRLYRKDGKVQWIELAGDPWPKPATPTPSPKSGDN